MPSVANVKPGSNVRQEPPRPGRHTDALEAEPKLLQVAAPPFHDSAVAIGFQSLCEPASTIGSVAGLPSSHTARHPAAGHLEDCQVVALADPDVLAERDEDRARCPAG